MCKIAWENTKTTQDFLGGEDRAWRKGLTTSPAKLYKHKGLSAVICWSLLTALEYTAVFKMLYDICPESQMLSLPLDLEAEAAGAVVSGYDWTSYIWKCLH